MKKNLSYLVILFVLSFLLIPSVEAIKVKNTDILYNSYVIGSYLFTSPDNDIENTENNKNAIYDGNALYTKEIMAGAITLGDTAYKDIKIYYKDFFDEWVDALTGSYFSSVAAEFEITHVNGICVDPVCDPDSDNIKVTFNYNNGTNPVEKKVLYNYLVDEPTVPTKLGHNFVCWKESVSGECYDFTKPVVKSLTLEADWEVINYEVTFVNTLVETNNTHKYTCNFASADKCNYQDFMFTLKDGYTFYGWSLAKTGEKVYNSSSNFDELFGTNPNIILYSIFESDDYTISYNLGGGTFDTLVSPPTKFDPSELSYTLPTPKREGYTFLGWESTDSEKATVTDKVKLTIKKVTNIELVAKWKANEYDVYVDSTDTKLNTSKCVYDSICTLDLSKVSVNGKTITKAIALVDGKEVSIGTNVKNLSSTNNDKVKVKLTYEDITYDINYELNGGTITGQPKTIKTGIEVTLVDPSKKGYEFAGWVVTKGEDIVTLTGKKLKLKDNATDSYENVVLSAKWTAITYSFKYDTEGTDNDYSVTCTYDVECTLEGVEEGRVGSTFAYWTLDNKDGVKLSNTILNYTDRHDAEFKLYPNYEYELYNVTYKLNGGVNHPDNPIMYYANEIEAILHDPSKHGYDFLKWTSNPTGLVDPPYMLNFVQVGENIELTAHWAVKEYNVTYDSMSGNTTPASHKCNYETCTISDTVVTKTGYEFAGWIDKATGYIYQPGAVVSNLAIENVTLEAKWLDEKPYTIKYNLNGGSFVGEHNVSYAKGTEPVLTEPEKFGYTFNGWTYKDGKTTGDIEVTANWVAIEYTVTFYMKNRVLATNTCTYGTECSTLASHERIVEEELIGWSYSNGGDLFYGLDVPSNYLCEFAPAKNGYSCSLYAVVNDTFNVLYDLNGGLVEDYTLETEIAAGGDVTLPTLVRDGYTFNGWEVKSGNAQVSEVDSNGYYTLTHTKAGDVKVVALFTEQPPFPAGTVTFDLTGDGEADTELLAPITDSYGATITLPDAPRIEGATFKGWRYEYMAHYKLQDDPGFIYELKTINLGETIPSNSYLLLGNEVADGVSYLSNSVSCENLDGCKYLETKGYGITPNVGDYFYLESYADLEIPAGFCPIIEANDYSFNVDCSLYFDVGDEYIIGKTVTNQNVMLTAVNDYVTYNITYMFDGEDITSELEGFPTTFTISDGILQIPMVMPSEYSSVVGWEVNRGSVFDNSGVWGYDDISAGDIVFTAILDTPTE